MSIENRDIATAIADHPAPLQRTGGLGHTDAARLAHMTMRTRAVCASRRMGISKNAFPGIFAVGKTKTWFSLCFIFNRLA